ncbi:lipocalin family protein [Mucilaginibacter sp.]
MRTKLLLLFFCALAAGACKKENVNSAVLTGKWKLVATYSSNGAQGNWTAVADKKDYDYIQFNADSTLTGNDGFAGFDRYRLKDSVTIAITQAGANRHEYKYELKAGTLTLSPSYPTFCIEGCASRYEKLKN